MAKRGPGKFSTDLDAAIYDIALNGADAEVGSSSEPPGTWAGLLKSGPDLARAIKLAQKDSESEGGGYHDVSREELVYLSSVGKAGVIITENDQGFVEVVYYDRDSDLFKDWEECERDLSVDEDEDLEPNRPRRQNSKLRDVSSKYGAPMGRASDQVSGNVTLERVRINDGGYDTGGAYWGTGAPLWRAQDEDGNEKFFRAADRAAAKAKLTDEGCTVVPGSGERQSEGVDFSKLESDGTLAQLLESMAESNDLPSEYWRELEITPELTKAAIAYEDALWGALTELVAKYPPKGDADANTLMEDGDAPYLVYLTLGGAGTGIQDGWGEFYDDDADEIDEKVRPFLKSKVGRWVDDSGSGKLDDALNAAVYENEKRLGIERDDEGQIVEREENRGRRPNSKRELVRTSPDPGRHGAYKYGATTFWVSGSRPTWVTIKYRHGEKDVEGNSVDEALEKAMDWVDSDPKLGRSPNGSRPSHRPNGQTPWLVLLNGEQTDIVYFADDMDADDVKRSLVNHDGYDPRITVKKRERRKTHAPDALAPNARRKAR